MPKKAVSRRSPPKTSTPQSLGDVLRALRGSAGITRQALAKAAGIDPAALARIETQSGAGIPFATLCRLADALDVSLDDLAGAAGLRRNKREKERAIDGHARLKARAQRARELLRRSLLELEQALEFAERAI